MLYSQELQINELENVITLASMCRDCGNTFLVEAPYDGYLAWKCEGKMLQYALPTLSHDERELILSGTCGPCYDSLFSFSD